MDVIIQSKKDDKSFQFQLEIWFFSTVLEIKEKIHKYHGVPVDKQTLYIRGVAMENHRDTVYYQVVEGSKLELVVHQDEKKNQEVLVGGDHEMVAMENVFSQQESFVGGHEVVTMGNVSGEEQGLGTTENILGQQEGLVGGHEVVVVEDDDADYHRKGKEKTITFKIILKVPMMRKRFSLVVEGGETVAQLLQIIDVEEDLKVGRIALVAGGVEMQDTQKTLREFGIVEGTEVVLLLMITVKVVVHGTKEKIDVEVNMMDNVSELRKKLDGLKDSQQALDLPDSGYFFIHKQDVMEEGKSLDWHHVKHNDTIEVFPGYVTDAPDK